MGIVEYFDNLEGKCGYEFTTSLERHLYLLWKNYRKEFTAYIEMNNINLSATMEIQDKVVKQFDVWRNYMESD